MPRAKAQRFVAIALALATICGCTAAPPDTPEGQEPPRLPNDGSIVLGGAAGTSCLSSDGSTTDLTYGIEGIGNNSDTDVEIRDVSLEEPRNISLVEALAVPVERVLIGNMSQWPPRRSVVSDNPEVSWDERKPAAGSLVPANTGDIQINLVLHLEAEKPNVPAGFRSIVVTVERDGGLMRVPSTIAFELKRSC